MSSSVSTERVFNVCLALLLMIPSGIIMSIVYIVYLVTCRKTGPFLYRGIRLGCNKKQFNIYKIRTLVIGAEKQIGGKLYANDNSKELWYGGFLRKTRIDELPQLFNVLAGDMDFVGPRPIRPAIYESQYKSISGIEKRFKVRPGITGYSQFYTPHGSPARLRVLIDNFFTRKNVGITLKVLFVFRTAMQFMVQLADEIVHLFMRVLFLSNKKNYEKNRRRFRRKKVSYAFCELHPENLPVNRSMMAFLINIDNESILLESPEKNLMQNDKVQMAITYRSYKNGRPRIKTIHCEGEVVEKRDRSDEDPVNKYVVNYSKTSDLATYALHKHLLKSSYAG